MAKTMNGKTNSADGSKGNGGMMPHNAGAPMRAAKGGSKIPPGKHRPVPGPTSATC